jgi:hypothetical protein
MMRVAAVVVIAACDPAVPMDGPMSGPRPPELASCLEQRDGGPRTGTPAPSPLTSKRISGVKMVAPDDATKTAINVYAAGRVTAIFKVCIDETGAVAHADLIQTSCFPRYDARLAALIATWKYEPITDSQFTRACGAVTFVYRQR